jgi:hypothetical protein
MPLNQVDSSKLNYQADIEYFKERIAGLQSGFVNPVVTATTPPDADQQITNLKDLSKKISNINDRIDYESAGQSIPIDKTKDASVSSVVLELDPSSGGEKISYTLYKKLSDDVAKASNSLDLNAMIQSSSLDVFSNSSLIQKQLNISYGPTAPVDYDAKAKQVINFADEYLGEFPDPSLIAWVFKKDAVYDYYKTSNYVDLWNNFSTIGNQHSSSFGGQFQGHPALTPTDTLVQVTNNYLNNTNSYMNDLNDLFNIRWSSDLLCCFIKFNIRLDNKSLKGFRTLLCMLRMAMNMDFRDLLRNLESMLQNMLRSMILTQLMNLIQQMIQRLVNPLKEWLNSSGDDPNWNKALQCLPVKVLLSTYINNAIHTIEKLFNRILSELYKDINIKEIHNNAKLSQAKQNQWIGTAIKILDMIERLMQLAAQCGQTGTPNAESAQKVIDSYNIDNPVTYQYPVDPNPNIYNSFINPEQKQQAAEGAQGASTTNQTVVYGTSPSTKTSDCLKNITNDDMPKPIVWM